MHFGVTMFATDQTMRPDELARAAEERGFVSLYVPEHTHIPVSRRTPPPTGDAVLPEYYRGRSTRSLRWRWRRRATERLRVGTGICLVAQRDPIVTAKAVASLDHLSNGRFVFGIGFGWNADEIEDHGVEMGSRRDVAREHVLAMQRLWADDVAGFDGDTWTCRRAGRGPSPCSGHGRRFSSAGPRARSSSTTSPSTPTDGFPSAAPASARRAQLHRAMEAARPDPAAMRSSPSDRSPTPARSSTTRRSGSTRSCCACPSEAATSPCPVLDGYAELVGRMTATDRVRIGTLGAARIAPGALIKPARGVAEVEVVAVAAVTPARAEKFAAQARDPQGARDVRGRHRRPGRRRDLQPAAERAARRVDAGALEAGKHVLCEKPFTANAAEAEAVAAAADGSGLVVMEAFHYRYHPLAQRMHDVVADGEIGKLERVETTMCIPLPMFKDIRYRYDLAGGATMDVGSYAVHQLRLVGGEEPRVIRADARLRSPKIDRWMQADVRWPEGHTGRMTCALWSSTPLKLSIRAWGERGELRVFNPTGPQFYHRFTVLRDGKKHREKFPRKTTYAYQLEAFTNAVLHGGPVLTPPADAVQNMRVIDAVYRAAGLPIRGEPD